MNPDRIKSAFQENMAQRGEVGAAVAVWQGEEPLVCVQGGYRDGRKEIPWDENTLVLVWSATKGPASACVLHALQERNLDLQTPVAEFWPAFARNGKESVRVAQIMSHQAGLSALDDPAASVFDHDSVVRALESQRPPWIIGEGHGYGPRTYGFIADEIVRRLTGGTPLGEYWRKVFAEPMGLEFWIGLPEALHSRVASMLVARAGTSEPGDPFNEALALPGSLTRRAFASPAGLAAASAMNAASVRSASIPSFGGIGSAAALAQFYSMLACGGSWKGHAYFNEKSLGWMTTRLSQGLDKVLRHETAFSAGFMMDVLREDGSKPRSLFGPSKLAFGHPGAGGSLAFADPETGIGFAYVMNQMELGVLPRSRAQALVSALYEKSV